MTDSPSTHGWEDFKPRESDDGTPTGRQLASYDGGIRLGARRRSSGQYTDWLFVTVRQRNGIWTRLCLDDVGTVRGQGFGPTRKAATLQLGQSLKARGIAAYRALDSNEADWR
jgi:hypothetical protein